MFAVVEVGSSQFKVSEGDVISANKIDGKEGDDIVLDKVLLFANDDDIRIGRPYLDGVKVTAKIAAHFLDKKVVAFKYRRRKDSSSKKGHRQKLTALNIIKIQG